MSRPQPGFDRLRPRSTGSIVSIDLTDASSARPTFAGSQARRPLFSVDEPGEAAFGSVSIECSRCNEISVLGLRQALRLAVPSLYLPVIRGRYPSWLHCPACGDWTWSRVRMRL